MHILEEPTPKSANTDDTRGGVFMLYFEKWRAQKRLYKAQYTINIFRFYCNHIELKCL